MFSVKFGNNLKNSVDVTEIVIKQFSKGSNIYIPPKTILKKVFSDQTKVAKNLYLFGLQKNKQDPIVISGYHIWNKGLQFVNKNQLEDTGPKEQTQEQVLLSKLDKNKYNFFNHRELSVDILDKIYDNIDVFSSLINKYQNILFICNDYPGYGGSATNCDKLQKFYQKNGHKYIEYRKLV